MRVRMFVVFSLEQKGDFAFVMRHCNTLRHRIIFLIIQPINDSLRTEPNIKFTQYSKLRYFYAKEES